MQTEQRALQQKRNELRLNSKPLAGAGLAHPADELERIAAYIREHDIKPDSYGAGDVVTELESMVRDLFGMEAARFMPSGCMAQPIALRIWAERVGHFEVAFHPTSHLELHEEKGYSALHRLKAHLLGDATRPTLAQDLEGLGPISSLLIELPAREIGGQLPTWEELLELVAAARAKRIRLHLDGARLWEAQAFYERPFPEICALFDSVYVSFYKGIGALSGAMLLGPQDFIDEAVLWQRRQGGTLYSALSNIVSAKMRLESQLERMPLYRKRAREIAALWSAEEGAEVLPEVPQVNMFHLLLKGEADSLLLARDRAAEQHGIWLINYLREENGKARCEVTIGEAGLALGDDELRDAIRCFLGSQD
jgi:threonine aldolase